MTDNWKCVTASFQWNPISKFFDIEELWHTVHRIANLFYSYVKPSTWGLRCFLAISIIEMHSMSSECYAALTGNFYGLPV